MEIKHLPRAPPPPGNLEKFIVKLGRQIGTQHEMQHEENYSLIEMCAKCRKNTGMGTVNSVWGSSRKAHKGADMEVGF